MLINILKTADSPLKANKIFSSVKNDINCDIYDFTSLLSPTFTIDYDSTIRNATHVYIPELGATGWYFFISQYEEKSATTTILHLSLDVRTTFINQYKECIGNIIRSDLGHPTDVVDNKLPLKQNNNIQEVIHFDEYQNSYFENGVEPNVLFMTL